MRLPTPQEAAEIIKKDLRDRLNIDGPAVGELVDELVKDHAYMTQRMDEMYDSFFINSEKIPKENYADGASLQICQHEWKPYEGLVESYKYCVHCDEKDSK